MPDQVSASNIGTDRSVEFTVDGITKLAWQTARMVNIRQEPDATEKEFARKWLNIKMDSLQARARIARSVILTDVTLDASTATTGNPFTVSLGQDVFDVIGDAKLVDSNGDETFVQMQGRSQWEAIVKKDEDGLPVHFYPARLDVITLYVWPRPSVDYTLRVQAVKYLRSASNSAETADVDRYFAEYLVNGLAYEIAKSNSIALEYCLLLRKDADRLLNLALGMAKQRGPTQMRLNHRTGWNRR